MRWLGWLRRGSPEDPAAEALDINQVVSVGVRDTGSARTSIERLKRERKMLVRRRKSVEASLKPVTRGQMRRIYYSSGGSDELGAYQLQQAMRQANESGNATAQRKEQVAAVDGRIREVDEAMKRLDEFVRERR